MTDKEKGLEIVKTLVERFNEQITSYKKSNYNETQTRRDFIDPFFKALGWDVDNEKGNAESFREVIHEDRVKVGGATKAPDYSFKLEGGNRLFFVEAKKPSVAIKDNIHPAYQVRRYGWSAKLNVSIITDFEEFAIYDCSIKPKPNDKASVARIKYLTYDNYENEWNFIWNTFSKEAVRKEFFANFIKGTTDKRGTETVDKEFLQSLDYWRTLLAENIYRENKQLDEDELNYIVQITLDRLIFLRIAEDISIEIYGRLQDALKSGEYFKNLLYIFKEADQKYNSGLFNFKKDTISENLKLNNKTLKTIINQLYYPESPYEFSVLSVEILGSAYEQFLGKVIQINNRGKAIIELKPEVRKSGGVYYTPKYVVDYIVKNTVGKLCENKTPEQVSELKIVDPACGSGSFLIGTYQYLLDWHKGYYNKKKKKKNPITPNGDLTTSEKKRILLNNIYGIDIDINAVEVTKLSLLLKSLEGETQASIAHQLSFYHERVLPTLDKNIKDGNSIIDTDYYDGQIDFGAAKKIKPFSWDDEFSEIKLNGGFDVVIGNPPYIKERGSKEIFEPVLKSRLGKLYHQGKMDFWYYFVHRGIDILKDNGYLGFITNSYWMKSDGASKLIERIGNNLIFDTIVDFDNYKVFEDVSGKHNISIFKKDSNKKTDCKVLSIEKQNPNSIIENYALELINNENLIQNSKIQLNSNINIFENCEILDIHFDTSVGVQESTDRITKKHKASTKREDINIGDGVFVLNENEILKANFNDEEKLLLKPYVNTSHINRYELDFRNEFLLYIGKTERQLIASGKYPNIKRHLDSVKEFITSSNAPYGIHRTREQRFFEEPKLICKGMFLQPEFYYDDEKYYFGFSFSSIIQKSRKYDLKLLLGIMNSKLGEFWFHLNGKRRGIGVDIGVKIFRLFPLPPKTNKNFDIISTKIIKLVEQLQSLKKDLKTQSLQTAKVQIERQIVYFEKRINEKVYKLYAFKKQEIEMIENKKNRLVNQPYLIQTL